MLGIFDGHNDSVQRLQEYCPDGIDFLARSTDGHLDLPRAIDGGLVGGLFAMFVRPEHPPVNDFWPSHWIWPTRDARRGNY
jgi:membrane dipeptidase